MPSGRGSFARWAHGLSLALGASVTTPFASAAVLLAFTCVVSASCLRGDPDVPPAGEDGVEHPATEDVGEARDETRWTKRITCNPDEYGPYCYRKCKEGGISCGAFFHHPRYGLGELKGCLSAPTIDACDYSHESDCIHCYLFKKLGSWAPAYCVLQGGEP